jgi:hypothetical protein
MDEIGNSKGIALPVNSVIIIALAIFVLLMISAFFGKSSGELATTEVTNAFNQGCSQLSSSYNCDYEKLPEIKTSLIINNEAKTLLDVCRMSFNNPSMSALKCKFACQVCPKRVFEGSPCEDPQDCISPLTSDWNCCFGKNLITEGKIQICQQTGQQPGFCYSPIVIIGDMIIDSEK